MWRTNLKGTAHGQAKASRQELVCLGSEEATVAELMTQENSRGHAIQSAAGQAREQSCGQGRSFGTYSETDAEPLKGGEERHYTIIYIYEWIKYTK